MDKLCLDCQAELKGRTDKKFCDDQCRSNYNNKLKVQDQGLVKKINQVLAHNRKVLKDENPTGKAKVKKEQLVKRGFDFDYHTHFYTTQNGHQYVFCYEYGYLFLANDEVLIVKK
ncbi:hypothetical protein [Pedobacter sp. UBA4863]|uniref:hypothetical protein n=1 Tax=Pedobacter sp. UBA4863 TaxID=1947060 RepID=UPI0025DFEC23|nr:hypothetical protein [Pedobacter sp. UBA4863]